VGNDATVQYSWQRIDVLAVKIGVNSLSLLLDHCSAYRTWVFQSPCNIWFLK
jgi:hypothetical protein